MKRKIKYDMLYILSGFTVVLLLVTLFAVQGVVKESDNDELPTTGYVYNILNKLALPVVNEDLSVKIVRPYTEQSIKIVKDFYDYQKNASEQQNALIYYEGTYMQSTGIAYSNDNQKFNVIAILDGKVTEVIEDQLIGNSITIEHDGITSIYQSLSEIDVKVGDIVNKGSIIGVTGTSNINSGLGNHLFFELIINGLNVNPEEYYDKEL